MQIIPNLCLAGAEVMCTNLAISLKRIGVDVIVVSLFKGETYLTERLRDEKINVLYLNLSMKNIHCFHSLVVCH